MHHVYYVSGYKYHIKVQNLIVLSHGKVYSKNVSSTTLLLLGNNWELLRNYHAWISAITRSDGAIYSKFIVSAECDLVFLKNGSLPNVLQNNIFLHIGASLG